MNDNHNSDNRPAVARETPPRGYDPDCPDADELRPCCDRQRGLGFWRGLILALFLVAGMLVLAALTAGASGCASPGAELPPGAYDFVTNYDQRVAAADSGGSTNEWWRTFPETEEEYLALCEPKIQEKLLDYPEEEREHMRELLRSEESTAYLFKSIYAELMRADEKAAAAGSDSSSTTEHAEDAEGASTSSQTPVASASSVVLDFRYGGFKASNPREDYRCRISKLRIGSDSLSFTWEDDIPSDWQRGDTKKGPMVLACAFYEDGGAWVGGKFDWIDEHRSGRSLENIHGGYGGWNAGAWNAATKRAFCVVSADGKHRSNLLEETR